MSLDDIEELEEVIDSGEMKMAISQRFCGERTRTTFWYKGSRKTIPYESIRSSDKILKYLNQ